GSWNVTSSAVNLIGVSASPGLVVGGSNASATVTLNGPAPAGGAAVTMQSSAPTVLQVPTTVTIPQGLTSKTVSVPTGVVLTSTGATVTATYSGVSLSSSVMVSVPAPSLTSVAVSPSSVLSGGTVLVTLQLSAPAPVG